MIDVLILAIALSMDALAVSIGLGAKHNSRTISLGLMCAAYFGIFQGIMPLIGYLGGRGVLSRVDSYAPLNTNLDEIMYSSVPSVDVENIIYRTKVRTTQPTGDYSTTITYVAVPVF